MRVYFNEWVNVWRSNKVQRHDDEFDAVQALQGRVASASQLQSLSPAPDSDANVDLDSTPFGVVWTEIDQDWMDYRIKWTCLHRWQMYAKERAHGRLERKKKVVKRERVKRIKLRAQPMAKAKQLLARQQAADDSARTVVTQSQSALKPEQPLSLRYPVQQQNLGKGAQTQPGHNDPKTDEETCEHTQVLLPACLPAVEVNQPKGTPTFRELGLMSGIHVEDSSLVASSSQRFSRNALPETARPSIPPALPVTNSHAFPELSTMGLTYDTSYKSKYDPSFSGQSTVKADDDLAKCCSRSATPPTPQLPSGRNSHAYYARQIRLRPKYDNTDRDEQIPSNFDSELENTKHKKLTWLVFTFMLRRWQRIQRMGLTADGQNAQPLSVSDTTVQRPVVSPYKQPVPGSSALPTPKLSHAPKREYEKPWIIPAVTHKCNGNNLNEETEFIASASQVRVAAVVASTTGTEGFTALEKSEESNVLSELGGLGSSEGAAGVSRPGTAVKEGGDLPGVPNGMISPPIHNFAEYTDNGH